MKTVDQLSPAELSRLVRQTRELLGKKPPSKWTRKTREGVRQVLAQAKLLG